MKNTSGKVSASGIAYCLSGAADIKLTKEFRKDIAFFTALDGFSCFGVNGGNDIVLYRMLVIYHFYKYVTGSQMLSRYIKISGDCEKYLKGEVSRDKITWNRLVASFASNDPGKIRKMFQATKQAVCGFEENMVVQKITDVMRRFTVESPLTLLQVLFPDVVVCKAKQVVPWVDANNVTMLQFDAVVYQVLNAHVNWITLSLSLIFNMGYKVHKWPPNQLRAEHYAVFCTICFRTFTTRTKHRRDTPKHSDMVYCSDTHTTVSSCCGALLGCHQICGTDGTVLEFHNGGRVIYRLNTEGRCIVSSSTI